MSDQPPPADLPFSPAAERNRAPILELLSKRLARECSVLEIASGTGQHAEHFAREQPGWRWQPTDGESQALPGIAARCIGLRNVAAPVMVDVQRSPWPLAGQFDAVYCANMLHISAWPSCAGLMRGVKAHVKPGGLLAIYGPFIIEGEPLAPSNAAFDASLNQRNPEWGLRRLGDVIAQAQAFGIAFEERVAMPANNQMLFLRVLNGAVGDVVNAP